MKNPGVWVDQYAEICTCKFDFKDWSFRWGLRLNERSARGRKIEEDGGVEDWEKTRKLLTSWEENKRKSNREGRKATERKALDKENI